MRARGARSPSRRTACPARLLEDAADDLDRLAPLARRREEHRLAFPRLGGGRRGGKEIAAEVGEAGATDAPGRLRLAPAAELLEAGERALVAGRDGGERSGRASHERTDELELRCCVHGHVQQHQRQRRDRRRRRPGERLRRQIEDRATVGERARLQRGLEPRQQLGDVRAAAGGSAMPGERARRDAAEPQLADGGGGRAREAGKPRHRLEVGQRAGLQRLEHDARRQGLAAERARRRDTRARQLGGGHVRGQPREARAVDAEGGADRRGHLPREVVGRALRRADDERAARRGRGGDERARGVQPYGGGARDEDAEVRHGKVRRRES